MDAPGEAKSTTDAAIELPDAFGDAPGLVDVSGDTPFDVTPDASGE